MLSCSTLGNDGCAAVEDSHGPGLLESGWLSPDSHNNPTRAPVSQVRQLSHLPKVTQPESDKARIEWVIRAS